MSLDLWTLLWKPVEVDTKTRLWTEQQGFCKDEVLKMFPLDDICEIFGTTHRTEEYYEQPNRGHLPKFAMDH